MHADLKKMAIAAKGATVEMAKASLEQKNAALEALVENLKKQQDMKTLQRRPNSSRKLLK